MSIRIGSKLTVDTGTLKSHPSITVIYGSGTFRTGIRQIDKELVMVGNPTS